MSVSVFMDIISPTMHVKREHLECDCVTLEITCDGDDMIMLNFAHKRDLDAFVGLMKITTEQGIS